MGAAWQGIILLVLAESMERGACRPSFFTMYELVRGLIDDVLMGPTLAPVTTFAIVLLLALAAISVITGQSPDEIEES